MNSIYYHMNSNYELGHMYKLPSLLGLEVIIIAYIRIVIIRIAFLELPLTTNKLVPVAYTNKHRISRPHFSE